MSTSYSTMTGSAPTGSMTPPVCRSAGVHAGPDLRARPTSAMRVDHRSSPIRADIPHIGGMQMTPGAIRAVADRRSAGTMHAGRTVLTEGVLVVERQ
jgi:hypothetical protein